MRRSLSDFAPLLPGDEGLPEILEEIRGELSVGVAWRELGTWKSHRPPGAGSSERPFGRAPRGGGLFVGSAAFLWAAAGGKPPEGPLS